MIGPLGQFGIMQQDTVGPAVAPAPDREDGIADTALFLACLVPADRFDLGHDPPPLFAWCLILGWPFKRACKPKAFGVHVQGRGRSRL